MPLQSSSSRQVRWFVSDAPDPSNQPSRTTPAAGHEGKRSRATPRTTSASGPRAGDALCPFQFQWERVELTPADADSDEVPSARWGFASVVDESEGKVRACRSHAPPF